MSKQQGSSMTSLSIHDFTKGGKFHLKLHSWGIDIRSSEVGPCLRRVVPYASLHERIWQAYGKKQPPLFNLLLIPLHGYINMTFLSTEGRRHMYNFRQLNIFNPTCVFSSRKALPEELLQSLLQCHLLGSLA